ncbi:MAG: hypothetical protein KJ065_27865 [Anaerolineae bacterium]|nr:hypothetical protein [Anaerolineae bacterium]
MFNPYFLVVLLYVALAVLGALDASLISFDLLPTFAGLRWARVHFITLGALTEFAFGVLPIVVAARAGLPRPKIRWDIWLTLNLGLLILLLGIPMVNGVFITAGGTLIFIAAVLLMLQLGGMRGSRSETQPSAGRKFYIVGLAYLLLGVLIGTGLWQGWSTWLQIKVPLEAHIHANNWGFMSLVFAGLIVDLYPGFAGRSLAWPRSITPIFVMMTLGALGLVLGPWFQSNLFTVPGMLLHISATIWLVLNMVKPLVGDRKLRTPGILHLVTAYVWIVVPILMAPLILLEVPGVPGPIIEQNAPQALIYGWVLQFGYAIIPLLFRRVFVPDAQPKLGGNWFSLIAVHLGGVFLWAGIFLNESQAALHGVAYGLWFVSMLPIAYELWQIVRSGMSRVQDQELAPTMAEAGD